MGADFTRGAVEGDQFSARSTLPVSAATPQDKNSIYLLLDAVSAAEMWSIIYEGTSGYPEGGLPIEHGRCDRLLSVYAPVRHGHTEKSKTPNDIR